MTGGTGSPTRACPAPPHAVTAGTRAMARATAASAAKRGVDLDLRNVAGTYCAVTVPVMFGWNEHTNVYCPAGRAGTS
jgi:hypothetical protein